MTHLHPDHASAIVDYPEATFLVSSAEWEAASDGGQRDGYVKRQFDHGFDYRLIDFDSNDANSFSGFARSFDVFGDGSVRVVFTPGHTLGPHVGGAAHRASGEVLVAGDAIFMHRTLDDDHLPHLVADEHLFRRSMREIRQYRKETPDALVIPGHDWEAWQKLDAELLDRHPAGRRRPRSRGADRLMARSDRVPSRAQAIRFSAWRRSSMYWNAWAWASLA